MSEIAFIIPYELDMVEKFDERFALDTDTQSFGYTTRKGVIRIFYKDSFEVLQSLMLNGVKNPIPEILYKPKG